MPLTLVTPPQSEPLAAHNKSGVYAIVHATTGRAYIGSAVRIGKRWNEHVRQLRSGRHGNRFLQRAWDKYGESAFGLVVCDLVDKDDLIATEQLYLDGTQSFSRVYGYNINPTAGSHLGRKFSDEMRAKVSASKTGVSTCTDEQRALLRESMRGNKFALGYRHTEESRAKMRAASVGKARRRGFRHPEELKKHWSAVKTGRTLTPEHCQRLSAALRGKKRSPESVARIAAANRLSAQRRREANSCH